MRYCASLRLLPLVSLWLAACVSGVGAGTVPISRPGLQGAASRLPPQDELRELLAAR